MRRSAEFRLVMRRGKAAGRSRLVAHLLRGAADRPQTDSVDSVDLIADAEAAETQAPPRVGFVVGRAVGGAVVRNRVRRRLRHLIRDRLYLLPPGSLLVVRANPRAATAGHDELTADLDSALDRLLRRPTRESSRQGSK
jgi:ribonuclease P protein component